MGSPDTSPGAPLKVSDNSSRAAAGSQNPRGSRLVREGVKGLVSGSFLGEKEAKEVPRFAGGAQICQRDSCCWELPEPTLRGTRGRACGTTATGQFPGPPLTKGWVGGGRGGRLGALLVLGSKPRWGCRGERVCVGLFQVVLPSPKTQKDRSPVLNFG